METILTLIFIILMAASTVALYVYTYRRRPAPEENTDSAVSEELPDGNGKTAEVIENSPETADETEADPGNPDSGAVLNEPETASVENIDSGEAETLQGGNGNIQASVKPENLKKRKLILISGATVIFAVQLFIFFFGTLRNEEPLLKAFINAEAFAWIAAIGYIDLKEYRIPNPLILAGLIFWALVEAVEVLLGGSGLKETLAISLIGGICGVVLFIVSLITKSGLGMGDVKLFFVLGLLFGIYDVCSILLITVIVMAIVSIILLIMKKADKKTRIPMAPFAVLGLLIQVITGV